VATNSKLTPYQAKRDFSQTAEPSGDEVVAPSEVRRYIIQKHAATRLHYDFRLELDGVLKYWAVTKGLSVDPHDKRLAVEVEDHPLDYGDFEGTIPEGQYGGGSVQLWDRGYWMPEERDPAAAINKGELKFVVKGERLQGGWVLVRIKSRRVGDKKNNWLLIKHRNELARDDDGGALLAADRSVAAGRPMADIAAGKGKSPKPFILAAKHKASPDAIWNSNRRSAAILRASGATNADPSPKITRSKPVLEEPKSNGSGLMPEFIAPELCKLSDHAPSGAGWIHEVKFDGYRIQARVNDGRAILRTRKGLNWTTKFGAIARAGTSLPDGIYDGEVVALDNKGVPDFGALQAALAEGKTDDLIYFVFDLLFAEGEDFQNVPLHERKAALKLIIGNLDDNSLIRYVEHFDESGESVLESARKMSLEGIVSKQLDDVYRAGQLKRSKGKETAAGG
jgi:bifunctional non-homologous end joining protein LigD